MKPGRINPSLDEAMAIVEAALRRRGAEEWDADDLRAFVAMKVGGVVAGKGLLPSSIREWAKEYLDSGRRSNCPPEGRRVMKSGKPFA